jgi:ribonuclease Z
MGVSMQRLIIWLPGLLLAIFALATVAIRVPAVQDRVVERGIDGMLEQLSEVDALFSDDALRVLLCGTSSPLPSTDRAKSCVAVFAAGKFWVVDTGPGAWNNLALWRIPGRRIGAVLLSHFHSDHMGELGEFNLMTWVDGRGAPLRVFGPPGVERVVAGFEEAYALDTGYRVDHHGAEMLPPEQSRMQALPITGGTSSPTVILEEDGLKITMFPVDHEPVRPAVGYRFDFAGRSVVVSGDTVVSPTLTEMSRGVDVLVHEAQANHLVAKIGAAAAANGRPRVAKIMSDIPDYHTSPVDAAKIANEAGVSLLVFNHLTPPPPVKMLEPVYVRGVAAVRRKDWTLGEDGMLIELPRDSDSIAIRSLN